jgi:hypothetical protein
MTALFRPWDKDSLIKEGPSFYGAPAYNAFLRALIGAARKTPEERRGDVDVRDHAFVMEKIINNTALSLRSSKAIREILGRFRFSCARRWGTQTANAQQGGTPGLQDVDVAAAMDQVAAATGFHVTSKADLYLANFRELLQRLTNGTAEEEQLPRTVPRMAPPSPGGEAPRGDSNDAARVAPPVDDRREVALSADVAECRARQKSILDQGPNPGSVAADAAAAANPNPFQDGAPPPPPDLPEDRAFLREVDEQQLPRLPEGLDREQRAFVEAAVRQIRVNWERRCGSSSGGVSAPAAADGANPGLMLLLGGPGCGKTYVCNVVAKAVADMAASPEVAGGKLPPKLLRCATTGAAAALVKGSTYHAKLHLGPNHIRSDNAKVFSDADKRKRFTDFLQEHDAIMIDECSMLGQQGLGMIEHRLRMRDPLLPFGGMVVIISGDFWQLPPVCDFPLYAPLATVRTINRKHKSALAATFIPTMMNAGAFTRHQLTQQHRVRGQSEADFAHIQMLGQLRDNAQVEAALRNLISHPETQFLDGDKGDRWPDKTTLLVSGNRERAYANAELAACDARRRGLPVLAFPLPTRNRALIGTPEATFFFVPDAPGVITQNMDVGSGITNGTSCTLSRLAFDDIPAPHRQAHNLAIHRYVNEAQPGEVVRFPHPPRFIVTKVARDDVVGGYIEVPVDKASEMETDGTTHFNVEAGYAMTYHKVQGMSLASVVLDLGARPHGKGCNLGGDLTLAALYVALSRVTSARGLWILRPRGVQSWQHIYRLRVAQNLTDWLGGGGGATTAAAAAKTNKAAPRRRERGSSSVAPRVPPLPLPAAAPPAAPRRRTAFSKNVPPAELNAPVVLDAAGDPLLRNARAETLASLEEGGLIVAEVVDIALAAVCAKHPQRAGYVTAHWTTLKTIETREEMMPDTDLVFIPAAYKNHFVLFVSDRSRPGPLMVYDSMPNYFEEERNKIARDVARQCAELGRPHVPEAFAVMDCELQGHNDCGLHVARNAANYLGEADWKFLRSDLKRMVLAHWARI